MKNPAPRVFRLLWVMAVAFEFLSKMSSKEKLKLENNTNLTEILLYIYLAAPRIYYLAGRKKYDQIDSLSPDRRCSLPRPYSNI